MPFALYLPVTVTEVATTLPEESTVNVPLPTFKELLIVAVVVNKEPALIIPDTSILAAATVPVVIAPPLIAATLELT